MYALCKLVPCGQVYEVNAVISVSLLESFTTVSNLNSKRHQILCIVQFQKIIYPYPHHRGNFMQLPPPPWNFHFLNAKITPHPSGISTSFMYTPIPPGKIVLARKYVKVKVNTQPSAWHVTAVYSRSIVTSEDTYKENILQFI